jgi:hypothetical protein
MDHSTAFHPMKYSGCEQPVHIRRTGEAELTILWFIGMLCICARLKQHCLSPTCRDYRQARGERSSNGTFRSKVIDASGSRNEIRIERYDFFIFDNLVIPFSGKLFLSYPYFDYWEVPWPIEDRDEVISHEIILAFDRGAFVGKSSR